MRPRPRLLPKTASPRSLTNNAAVFPQLNEAHQALIEDSEAALRDELARKDEQIEALMAEGKRYSDQSVKSANINKKLQKKNKARPYASCSAFPFPFVRAAAVSMS